MNTTDLCYRFSMSMPGSYDYNSLRNEISARVEKIIIRLNRGKQLTDDDFYLFAIKVCDKIESKFKKLGQPK